MLRNETDNEVSICCFYAVIRNCHTPLHFFISLGLFACWNFLWSRMESIKLAPTDMKDRAFGCLPTSAAEQKPEAGSLRARCTAKLQTVQLPWTLFTWHLTLPGSKCWPSPPIVIVEHFGSPKLISLLKHFHSIPIIFPFLFAWADLKAGTLSSLLLDTIWFPQGFSNSK